MNISKTTKLSERVGDLLLSVSITGHQFDYIMLSSLNGERYITIPPKDVKAIADSLLAMHRQALFVLAENEDAPKLGE